MKKYLAATAMFSLAFALLSGCASYSQKITLPSRESDLSRVSDGLEVSLALARKELVGLTGVLVVMDIKNISDDTMVVAPEVLIFDSDRKLIGMGSLSTVLRAASRKAGTPVPEVFLQPAPNYSALNGVLTDYSTGRQYGIQGAVSSGSSFSSGFAMGSSIGSAMAAANKRAEGDEVLNWAESRWLKAKYSIPPGVTVEGELYMPYLDAKKMDRQSMISVYINDKEQFKFRVPYQLFE